MQVSQFINKNPEAVKLMAFAQVKKLDAAIKKFGQAAEAYLDGQFQDKATNVIPMGEYHKAAALMISAMIDVEESVKKHVLFKAAKW